MNIEFKVLDEALRTHGVPKYATPGAAAVDIRSIEKAPVTIRPGETYAFKTGFGIDLGRPSHAAIVMPRSGLGARDGLVLANTIGLIDSDYQGEITCVALNRNRKSIRSCSFFKKYLLFLHVAEKAITVNPGDRIFQMYITPVVQAQFAEVTEFSRETERGAGGYGSTGRA
jgi:dUTP pyrophosphatase